MPSEKNMLLSFEEEDSVGHTQHRVYEKKLNQEGSLKMNRDRWDDLA